ncbi:Tetratricopeptide repeat protein [compost metagenome]
MDSSRVNVYNSLGISYLNDGRYNAALVNFRLAEQKILAKSKNKIPATEVDRKTLGDSYFFLGRIYLEKGENRLALKNFKYAFKVNPKDAEAGEKIRELENGADE